MGMEAGNHGYLASVKQIYRAEGMIGFYHGCLPPFFGSIIFRSLQFSVYEMVYTKCQDHRQPLNAIPFSGGIQFRVLYGGLIAGTVRSLLECPFEYAKVKGQTN
mmetsp:Transcript_1347/g.1750  ORF Transcript_1347/g.1750 Transcript_1347/m.1750 type:complete len:104 (+) Transcript_1347:141-452(+)